MSHFTRYRVHLNDVLEHLSSYTAAPSSMGNALERARDGVSGGGADPIRAQGQMEESLLRRAATIRCVDKLAGYNGIKFAPVDYLGTFAKRIRAQDGAIVVATLRAYQSWAAISKERGLVEVYRWMRSVSATLPPIDTEGEADEAQAFRVGKAKKARGEAARLLADADVVLSVWVERWNARATDV